jgi:hypothetical protein
MDHAMPAGSALTYPDDLTSYFKQNEAPACPARGVYSLTNVGSVPICSLGASVTPNHVLQ